MTRQKHRLVYICSPYRGDTEKNIQKAQDHCRAVMSLWPDAIPIAPHVYFTQFLNDDDPVSRRTGTESAEALLEICDEMWVYGMDNPSEGMLREIAFAKEHNIPIRDAADIYRNGCCPGPTPGDLVLSFTENLKLRLSYGLLHSAVLALRRNDGKDICKDVLHTEELDEMEDEDELG